MSVVMKVMLSSPVTGQQIMDAVEALAGSEYYKNMVDDSILYEVGRRSLYPYEDLIIKVGEGHTNTRIDPGSNYEKVAVVHHEWPGEKYAVGFSNDSIVDAMQDFRDHLQAQLIN